MGRKKSPPPEPLPDIVAIVAQYMANPVSIWPVLDRFEEDADAGLFGDHGDNFELLATVGNLRPESGFTINLATNLWFSHAQRNGHSWSLSYPKRIDHAHDERRLGFCFSNDASWYSFQPDWASTKLEDVRWAAKRWRFRSQYERTSRGEVTRISTIVRAHWQSAPVYFDAPGYAWAHAGAAGLLSCVVAAADYANRIEANLPATTAEEPR